MPSRADLPERLDAVLDAIYATYAEGRPDPMGTEARRRSLAEEAIWLGRLVALPLPQEPEARAVGADAARAGVARRYVPPAEQDTTPWDAELIDEDEGMLFRASE